MSMSEAIDRKALEARHGKVWSAEELEQSSSSRPSSARTSWSGARPTTW
jgi:hypothetical protein